jgi:hypothetical protein
MDWNERRLRLIAGESRVETIVDVQLCRDSQRTLENALGPHSVVVLGRRKRWWPTNESKLARSLQRAGHEEIFVETE